MNKRLIALTDRRKLIVPCSGIGKTVGEVTREATRILIEELRPGVFDTVCLARIMMDEEEDTRELIRTSNVITIDGCPERCATTSVKFAGGTPVLEVLTVKVLAKNRTHRPKSILDIGEGGRQLARDVAEVVIENGGA